MVVGINGCSVEVASHNHRCDLQPGQNLLDVVNATSPGAAAGGPLQGGPKPCVIGEVLVGMQIVSEVDERQAPASPPRAKTADPLHR